MAALSTLATAPVFAEPETVELRYAAPAGCPARDAVAAAIVERTPNVRLAAPARRVFAITIDATDDGFRGRLEVDRVADKELSAQRCDDLATALALVTALAIDPTASVAPRPVPRVAPPPPVAPPRPPAASSVFEAQVGGMVDAGVAPDAMYALVVEGRARIGHYRVALAGLAGQDQSDRADAAARFVWLAARPAVCRLWQRGALGLGACGHAEIGAVRASGEMIVNQRDVTRLWLAAGAHATADVPLSARIFGQLQIGASFPLLRDRYRFAPDVAVHDTPSATGWFALGVGLRFP